MADKTVRPHALDPAFTRILCISAHPDDNEFTIGGAVAAWAREGREIVFCLVTTGGAGTNEHTTDNTGLVPIRERESWDAAKLLGVKDLVFLGYQDGVVEPTIGLRRDLTRVIRRSRPDVVVPAGAAASVRLLDPVAERVECRQRRPSVMDMDRGTGRARVSAR